MKEVAMQTGSTAQSLEISPAASPARSSVSQRSPKLLDAVRNEIRLRHYSIRTEHAYVDWIKRYIEFHGMRHPREMGASEVTRFLTHLATHDNVAANTQNQALCALVFLYRHVLKKDIGEFSDVVRAKRPQREPTVMSLDEVERVIGCMSGTHKLMALLMYGTGMRIIEVIRLRIKDIDFDMHCITVRDGKGQKDRQVPLPVKLAVHPPDNQREQAQCMTPEDESLRIRLPDQSSPSSRIVPRRSTWWRRLLSMLLSIGWFARGNG
jgi:integrase